MVPRAKGDEKPTRWKMEGYLMMKKGKFLVCVECDCLCMYNKQDDFFMEQKVSFISYINIKITAEQAGFFLFSLGDKIKKKKKKTQKIRNAYDKVQIIILDYLWWYVFFFSLKCQNFPRFF